MRTTATNLESTEKTGKIRGLKGLQQQFLELVGIDMGIIMHALDRKILDAMTVVISATEITMPSEEVTT